MKLLLDENLPHQLRLLLAGHDVYTVAYMNWKGIENGDLLALAASNGFDAVVTKDSGIEYEQNVGKLPCSVVILQAKSNSIRDIRPRAHVAIRAQHIASQVGYPDRVIIP